MKLLNYLIKLLFNWEHGHHRSLRLGKKVDATTMHQRLSSLWLLQKDALNAPVQIKMVENPVNNSGALLRSIKLKNDVYV
jgi:hypothetical protein